MIKIVLKITVFIFIIGGLPIASAAVYQIKHADGSVSFSDQPAAKAKKVKLTPANISYRPSVPSEKDVKQDEEQLDKTEQALDQDEQQTQKKEEPKKEYKLLKIISPAQQQTFQNQRYIGVNVVVDPALFPGDQIQLVVDGQPYGTPSKSTALGLNNLDRGSHVIQVRVIDKTGRTIISSQNVTIFVHYASLGARQIITPAKDLIIPAKELTPAMQDLTPASGGGS